MLSVKKNRDHSSSYSSRSLRNRSVYLYGLNDIIVDLPWLSDRSELLTHTLWLPPYTQSQNWPRLDLPGEWYQNILDNASIWEAESDELEEDDLCTGVERSDMKTSTSQRQSELSEASTAASVTPTQSTGIVTTHPSDPPDRFAFSNTLV
ncbi:hypothetical protein AB6A40_008828 [Gnathostoma spinigerum]|uniref:Uncharacterized protein n=1 Tax=Gnathostoma spinigerum TaxID=75299 RepID=A0ABD6EVA6_9BILA